MINTQPISVLRPRLSIHAAESPLTDRNRFIAIAIFISLVAALIVIISTEQLPIDWLALVPYILVSAVTVVISVRLDGGLYTGFAPVSTFTFAMIIGFERATLALTIGCMLVVPYTIWAMARAGLSKAIRRTSVIEGMYSQGTAGLSILGSGWLYHALEARNSISMGVVFLVISLFYLALTALRSVVWLWLRRMSTINFTRQYWHLLLVNHFVAIGLAPIVGPVMQADPLGVDGLLLYTFGLLLLTVLDNGYLEVIRRLAHLSTLNSIGRALTSSLELEDLLRTIRSEIGQLVDVSCFYLAMYDENSATITFPVDYEEDISLPPTQIRFGQGSLTEHVIRSQRPLMINHDVAGFLQRMQIKPVSRVGLSYLGVPIISDRRVIGVIALRSFRRENAFSQDDVTLLQGIAAQAGVALQNATLYQQSRRQATELSSLNRVATLLAASTDLDRLITIVCQMVVDVMGYDKAAVWLVEPDGKTARLVNSIGMNPEFEATSTLLPLDSARGEVFRTGRPVVIPDMLMFDRLEAVANIVQGANFRSVVEVPLAVGSNVIGSVAAYYTLPRAISPSEIELLETLGGLIAVAVESARLFEAISSRSHELATLYEASESLNASLSLKNVLRALSVTMIQSLHIASCSTWLTDDSGLTVTAALRMVEIDGGGNEEAFSPVELNLEDLPRIQHGVKHRRPVILSINDPQLTDSARRLLEHCNLADGLLLPLVMHGHMVGLLAIGPPKGQTEFDPEQVRMAAALANQAAVAIDNARRFERTDIALANRVDELSALERVSRRMTLQLDLQSVIEEVAQAAVSATGVEFIDIALLDEQAGLVRTILRRTSLPEVNVPMEWRADKGLTGRSLHSRQTVRVGDVTQDADYLMVRENVHSELIAPIVLEDQIIGILNLESIRYNAFTPEHERFVTNLAEYAAIAIANARLYESEHRQREIAEILLETSAAVSSSPSLSEVLLTLSRQLLKISGFHGCTILELNEEATELALVTEHTHCLWAPGRGRVYSLADYPTTAHVISSGKSIVLHPAMPDSDPAEITLMDRHGLAALLMLPIKSGRTVIGLVEVTSATAELAADKESLRRCEQVLKNASRWLKSPLGANHSEELFELARQLTAQNLYSNCWLSAYNRKANQIETILQYGDLYWPTGRGPNIKLADAPVIAEVIKTGRSMVTEVDDEGLGESKSILAKWGMHTQITQPLARKGHPIGVIQLFNVAEDRQPTDDELRLWRLVGDQTAVAIENADLFEAIQRRGEEFSTLRSLAVELIASTTLQDSLQTICRHAIERTDAAETFIYLYDHHQDLLTFGTSLWRSGEVDQPTMPPYPETITAVVAETGSSMVIADLQQHPMFASVAKLEHWQGIHSLVGMPLRSSGQTIGVFVAAFAEHSHPGNDTLHFLDLLAAQAAVAIENIRLGEETITGRDRLEAVLNSSHDGLMMFDPDQRLVLANPRTEYLLNFRLSDKTQHHLLDIMQRIGLTLDDHDRDGWMREALHLAGSLHSDPLTTTRRRYTLGTATPHAIEETSVAVTDAKGILLGRLFVLHDVTDQVQLEAYRDELSSMIVHDLRSPLGSLITGLDMALSEVNSMPESQHSEPLKITIGVGLNSANMLLRLVEAILDVNKLETGEMPLALRPMDLRKTARVALERLEPSASAAEISVKITASKRLPHIVADQEKIERVMVNLLDNALRYTPRGGHITIDIQSHPTHQTVSVTDSGAGIAPEYRERVFERFFQLNAQHRKRGSKGTGLGLTFCRLAVEAHQGRIWVDEGPEGGASFHFTLPTDLPPTLSNPF